MLATQIKFMDRLSIINSFIAIRTEFVSEFCANFSFNRSRTNFKYVEYLRINLPESAADKFIGFYLIFVYNYLQDIP